MLVVRGARMNRPIFWNGGCRCIRGTSLASNTRLFLRNTHWSIRATGGSHSGEERELLGRGVKGWVFDGLFFWPLTPGPWPLAVGGAGFIDEVDGARASIRVDLVARAIGAAAAVFIVGIAFGGAEL